MQFRKQLLVGQARSRQRSGRAFVTRLVVVVVLPIITEGCRGGEAAVLPDPMFAGSANALEPVDVSDVAGVSDNVVPTTVPIADTSVTTNEAVPTAEDVTTDCVKIVFVDHGPPSGGETHEKSSQKSCLGWPTGDYALKSLNSTDPHGEPGNVICEDTKYACPPSERCDANSTISHMCKEGAFGVCYKLCAPSEFPGTDWPWPTGECHASEYCKLRTLGWGMLGGTVYVGMCFPRSSSFYIDTSTCPPPPDDDIKACTAKHGEWPHPADPDCDGK